MKILTRMCTSLDGHVTTPEGLPVQLAYEGWDADALGFYELQARCDAVLMGRTTFEPALSAKSGPGVISRCTCSGSTGPRARLTMSLSTLIRPGSWTVCGSRTKAATFTWSAANEPSRPFMRSARSTNSASWSCRFSQRRVADSHQN